MVEGPESRWALHNYLLEDLFLSHRNMLLIYIDRIHTINEFIGSFTKVFEENVLDIFNRSHSYDCALVSKRKRVDRDGR